MNSIKARIEKLAKDAAEMKFEVGKPCSVSEKFENGSVIGAARISGAIRFKVNGVYTSKAKAILAAGA